jgi:serine/threonine-protein kinase
LIGVDGVSRLADFGIAKAKDRIGFTRTGTLKGKISYMSPEQLRGVTLDRRADVWAAGVVAWELFAGQRLARAETEPAAIFSILTLDAPRLRSVNPDVSEELDEVVAIALQRDRACRYPSAETFRSRLLAACSDVADAAEVGRYVAHATEAERAALRSRALSPRDVSEVEPTADGTTRSRLRFVRQALVASLATIAALVGILGVMATRAASSRTALAPTAPASSNAQESMAEPDPLPPPAPEVASIASSPAPVVSSPKVEIHRARKPAPSGTALPKLHESPYH